MDLNQIERLGPMEIERRSFEIITQEAGDAIPDDERAMIIKRVIHTSADFDYVKNRNMPCRSRRMHCEMARGS